MSSGFKKVLAALVATVSFYGGIAQATPVQSWVTPQGTRVYFIETHALPMVDVQVNFLAGSAFDPVDRPGTAALTAGLMDQGAGKRNEQQVAETLADIGAQLSTGASLDRATISLRTLTDPERLQVAVGLLADVMAHPQFDPQVFTRDQARSVAALKEALTKPEVLAQRAYMAALYPDHPYGQQVTPETLAAVRYNDVSMFWRQHFTAARASVALVGDLTRQQAEALVQKITADLPEDMAAVPKTLPQPKPTEAKVVQVEHPAAQAHLLLGMPSVARDDPDQIALQVGNYSLGGGGFVSELTKAVRDDRGYAYSVYSYFQPQLVLGPFTIGLQTKRAQANDALKVVHQVLDGYLQRGPSAAELKAAQDNIAGGFALRIDSNSKLVANLGSMVFYGLPTDWLDQYPARVRALTPEAVRAAFRRHVAADQLVTVRVATD